MKSETLYLWITPVSSSLVISSVWTPTVSSECFLCSLITSSVTQLNISSVRSYDNVCFISLSTYTDLFTQHFFRHFHKVKLARDRRSSFGPFFFPLHRVEFFDPLPKHRYCFLFGGTTQMRKKF